MIRLKNIVKTRGELKVLDGISLDILERKITAVIGPSGCGKTTLLHILSGLDKDFEGKLEGMPPDLSFCFQEERLLPWKTARENIEFVQPDPRQLRVSNDQILEVMELSEFSKYPVKKLSGGMRQRVAIARAIAYPSGTVLMDEPFKSLDTVLKQNIFQDLTTLLEGSPRTVVLVTHDLSEAFLLADRIAVLSERPAKVMKVIEVPFARRERSLEQKEFSEMKKEIISYWI